MAEALSATQCHIRAEKLTAGGRVREPAVKITTSEAGTVTTRSDDEPDWDNGFLLNLQETHGWQLAWRWIDQPPSPMAAEKSKAGNSSERLL
uniref:Uncharacterized protein n=1 Tax=Arundo donax TaxID=35708 RepID=A0A0A8Z1N4_ARUDO